MKRTSPLYPLWRLFRKGAGVAIVTGEVFVNRVEVKETVAFGIQFRELLAAALSQDRMTRIAIVG